MQRRATLLKNTNLIGVFIWLLFYQSFYRFLTIQYHLNHIDPARVLSETQDNSNHSDLTSGVPFFGGLAIVVSDDKGATDRLTCPLRSPVWCAF